MSHSETNEPTAPKVVVTAKAPQQGQGPCGLARYIAESNLNAGLEGDSPRPLFTSSSDALPVEEAESSLSDRKGGPLKRDVIHLTILTMPEAFEAAGDTEEGRRAALRAATRAAMAAVEESLGGVGLRWFAAVHRNTGEPHVHVALGRDPAGSAPDSSARIDKLPSNVLPKGDREARGVGVIEAAFSNSLSSAARPEASALLAAEGAQRSPSTQATAHSGFSMVELLIVVAVIGILAGIAIPNMLASRRAAQEGTAKVKLAQAGGQERMYRSTLKKNTYATIAQLQATLSGGAPLLSAGDTTVTGWAFSEVAGAITATTFGLKAVPTADNPADRSYVIFEDNELRRCPRTGPWDRNCTRVEQ
ncbi:MAG: prepilin-type N-terminal cleavage/methylation domain-containing protein [Pyrinomonadaceae bacterium]